MAEEKDEAKAPTKAPRSISSRGRQEKSAEPAVTEDDSLTQETLEPAKTVSSTKREVISEGETFEVEVTTNDEGLEVVKENVYKEVNLPNSKRTTKRLIKAAGTRIY